jgi:hypothetical protein
MDAAFTYPSLIWLLLLSAVFAVCGWLLVRKIPAAVFVGCATLFVSWMAYDALLYKHMEKWLADQRVYAILFRDFPPDKERFISEYVAAFNSGGEEAVARKHEEMKIIMMVNHVKYYIDRTPSEVIRQHIIAETWLLHSLSTKDHDLCQRYLAYSGVFGDVWRTVGDDIFLASIRYNPQMIVEATDHPEPVSDSERSRAQELYTNMVRALQASGATLNADNGGALPCDTVHREFYLLSEMPPKDAALVIKFMYSADHLKQSALTSFLQQLVPFK